MKTERITATCSCGWFREKPNPTASQEASVKTSARNHAKRHAHKVAIRRLQVQVVPEELPGQIVVNLEQGY